MIEKIANTVSDNGDINTDNIELTQPVTVLLNPEDSLDKLQKLRSFKRTLKNETSSISNEDKSENYKYVKNAILDQYRKRINEVIVDQFGHAVKIKKLAEEIGIENLSQEESELLGQFSGLDEFVSVYSRFDKFVFGVDGEADENGNYKQVGEKIESYADEMEKRYVENELTKKQKASEKGLDFNKLMKKDISRDIFSKYAQEFLQRYGQKSFMPADEFDPKRKGPAPDGKWQFVTSDRYGSMSVDNKQKVIKAPTRDRSAQELISVMLGHEFTHFLQAINQGKIKLKLYDDIGGDRRMVLAEGAAMSSQKQISEEFFGFSELPKPNYVKAMSRKIKGGNYLDCVKEYYDCSLRMHLKTNTEMDPESLRKKAREIIGVSVRGCRRLFRTGENLESRSVLLSKSKDTVYLEQLMVMDRLREAGLEKFALVWGLNLDSLFVLLQNGFIDEKEIETLDTDFIRGVWNGIKHDFVINNES